jgi:catalase
MANTRKPSSTRTAGRRPPTPATPRSSPPPSDSARKDAAERAGAPGQPTSKPIEPARAKAPSPSPKPPKATAKIADLERNRENGDGQALTTSVGVRIEDDQNSLKAGVRGPSLLEDFHLREKITHFDHERIPERVVHARGAGAHGFFQVYEPLGKWTSAGFLTDPARRTPVFVRFSTVVGSRGSTDLARDVRGFAVKFYTEEGNFDLVGNNIPVFFIQDAVKFPDLVHSVKPEPHNEMPQAAAAHDTFWDFISLMPESAHMILWAMSDRAIPRSYRMMEGFGVHTFRLVNDRGQSRFVKFHWKPLLGLHQVVWDEAQKISGKDPDFHRRDLWDAIANGNFPEWELGVQVVEEKDEDRFDFDLLDATKIIPEELVPVQPIGRMTLDRNPDNFFAETEQVAFQVGNLVPGIDVTEDPLMQGRLFSYLDTQLIRLGGPNFNEIPINRPVAPVHTLQRDGHVRHEVNRGRVSYEPNSLGGGCPFQSALKDGGFRTVPRAVEGTKIRGRGEKFFDHFTQARMFFISQTAPEQQHIVDAFQFELGKVTVPAIRERMVGILALIHDGLATRVAEGLGIDRLPKIEGPVNLGFPAGVNPRDWQPKPVNTGVKPSPATSMASRPGDTLKTRQVAILFAEGSDGAAIAAMQKALEGVGAKGRLVGRRLGPIATTAGELAAEFSVFTTSSVLFDAVFVPGGEKAAEALRSDPQALEFVCDAFLHYKPIAATGAGSGLLDAAGVTGAKPHPKAGPDADPSAGVVVGDDRDAPRVARDFIAALGAGRQWTRGLKPPVPA